MGGAISAFTRVFDALWPRCYSFCRDIHSARYPSYKKSKRDAGRPQDHADRLLLEAALVVSGDLVETRDTLGMAGQHDQHVLAQRADVLLAGRVPPLAGGVVHAQPVRK